MGLGKMPKFIRDGPSQKVVASLIKHIRCTASKGELSCVHFFKKIDHILPIIVIPPHLVEREGPTFAMSEGKAFLLTSAPLDQCGSYCRPDE